MVDPLLAYANGNAFATGNRAGGGSAVKALFDQSTAPPAQDDPFGLLASANTQAQGLALQAQVEQGLRGPDGGLGRLTTLLDRLNAFIVEGQGDLDPQARAELQGKIDNLLEDFAAIAGNPQLTDPALIAETGLLDLGSVDAPISVASAAEARAAETTLTQTSGRLADSAGAYAQASELQRGQDAVFGALTGVSGLGGYGETGALTPTDARALIYGNASLGLFA